MNEKSKSFDILGDILSDSPSGLIRGLDELSTLIYASPKGSTSQGHVPPPTEKKRRTSVRRRKTTHYLRQEIFENLGEASTDIRDVLPEASKSKASKSRIIESAISVVLQEFEAKGKESALVRELLKKSGE